MYWTVPSSRPLRVTVEDAHAGEAEVHDLHLAAGGDADVGGLHVAVHDAVAVRVGQPLAHLPEDVERPLDASTPRALDDVLEVGALDVLHRDVGLPGVLADVVHGDDVGMAQAAGGLRLAQEAHAELGASAGAEGQRLHGDAAVEARDPARGRRCPCCRGPAPARPRTCRSCRTPRPPVMAGPF